MLLHAAWIHEWGEIDRVIGKKESETVKHFITIPEDRVRPPYGRKTETWKRQSILVGTTNRADFIKDHTGNRRYPITSAKHVNIKWVQQHRDAIWARAQAEYDQGKRWWYEADEAKAITDKAQGYAEENYVHSKVEEYVTDVTEITVLGICTGIPGWSDLFKDDRTTRQIRQSLSRLGFKEIRNKRPVMLDPDGGKVRQRIWERAVLGQSQ
jgi:predicted P-loop ATPase